MLSGAAGLILPVIASITVFLLIIVITGIIPPTWKGISLGLSSLMGVVSGLYPALNAAKMDPVKALNYE